MDFNRKLCVDSDSGGWKPRVTQRAAKGKRLPRLLIKCGCCDESVEAYYGGGMIEINGVYASTAEWEKIFTYLLEEADSDD